MEKNHGPDSFLKQGEDIGKLSKESNHNLTDFFVW